MLHEETDSRIMRLAAKAWRKLAYREQWFLQIERPASRGLMPEPQHCTPLFPPPDRLWADPFVWSTPQAHYVFVEELPFATNKGHIAVLELARDGTWRGARTVLEQPHHLSYPSVFQWDGVLYMMPESGRNGTVDLYRCAQFPDRWVHDRVLFADVFAADATLYEHAGEWWLFMTQAAPGESIDAHLYLYHAATPLGPFTPHPANPVKSGLRGTRPAGALFVHDGVLYRPAQDCSRVYGEAVVLQRVDELSHHAFRETEVARMEPRRYGNARRVHTLNAGDGLRVIDALRWIAK